MVERITTRQEDFKFLCESLGGKLEVITSITPAVCKAGQDLKVQGVLVTTFGTTRLTAVTAYCLITGESPWSLYGRGSLAALLGVWGWGLWLNDFFDGINPLNAARQGLKGDPRESFPFAYLRKGNQTIFLMDQKEEIIASLPKDIQHQVRYQVDCLVKDVATLEEKRPSVEHSLTERIFAYKYNVNLANARPLIAILCIKAEETTKKKVEEILVPFMQAACLIDDIVGLPTDTLEALPTYGTWALRQTGEHSEALAEIRTRREWLERNRDPDKGFFRSGVGLLETTCPATKKLLKDTFHSFLNKAPDYALTSVFKVGERILYKTYPWACQTKAVQYVLGLTGPKGRQNFTSTDPAGI